MAAICQDSSNPGSNLFGGPKGLQAPPSHNYYSHCGYEVPNEPPHQYSHEGYGQYQMTSLHHQQQQLHPHHPHHPPPHPHLNPHPHHQSPHHQQTWGSYGMGVMGGTTRSPHTLPLADEWAHGYLMAGNNNGSPQTPYGYHQYRPSTNPHHSPLDYGTPPHMADSSDHQALEDSMSPQTPSPRGPSPSGSTMGPNNQGAKSLKAPYEWMKPSATFPASGKTRTKDKYRVVYSDHQRLELEKEFHFSKYITIRRKAEIAGQLGLSERQVKIWFQNRRAKERKQNKKREEQALTTHSQPQNQTNNTDIDHNIQQQQQQQQQQPQSYISQSPTGVTAQSMQHHLQQNGHNMSAASYMIPKLEVDDDIVSSSKLNNVDHHHRNHHAELVNMARMGYHSNQNLSIPTSEQVLLAMNNNNNHNSVMTTAAGTGSIPVDRCHAQNQVNRYHHEGYPLPPAHVLSPGNHVPDDLMTTTLKMTSSDSSNNSMNLSGSSDSGVLSSQ